ncbi:hypothetical protein MPTK1_4g12280 [Marchantia polymorpha subsp. ruderalis]|uniref:Uncharacterized protein n=2 Tax=Marchantia polymorpha TaxID=3197 RepID=A0AAF6B943_MARPO|nr:hypothetical protein MARPO_0011s0210 [Marchantia polymorpha]BBN08527.1 hypothetical protein Mp_4g12280 [Marchantia polymorpha subsp. ruderalis]|eukprot:PTQ46561.1 hypothetical protein MARPO_0011s0210 [Marchantia polymorpha]
MRGKKSLLVCVSKREKSSERRRGSDASGARTGLRSPAKVFFLFLKKNAQNRQCKVLLCTGEQKTLLLSCCSLARRSLQIDRCFVLVPTAESRANTRTYEIAAISTYASECRG